MASMDVKYWDEGPWVGYNYANNGGIVQAVQQMCWCDDIQVGQFDGIYGPKTESAIKTWQGRCGLTQDGIVGNKTWDSFWSYLYKYNDRIGPNKQGFKFLIQHQPEIGDLHFIRYFGMYVSTGWVYYDYNDGKYHSMDSQNEVEEFA